MAKNDKGRPPGGLQGKFPKQSREFHRTLERKGHALAERICSSIDLDFPFIGVFKGLDYAFSKLSKRLALAEWCLSNKHNLKGYQSRAIAMELMWQGNSEMSPKSVYSGEAEDQRTDAISIGGDPILSIELKRAGLPASPETFTQNIYNFFRGFVILASIQVFFIGKFALNLKFGKTFILS